MTSKKPAIFGNLSKTPLPTIPPPLTLLQFGQKCDEKFTFRPGTALKLQYIDVKCPYLSYLCPPPCPNFCKNKTRRSQKLTPRQPKGNKIRGFKVKTSTQKLKSQYVSSAKQSKN